MEIENHMIRPEINECPYCNGEGMQIDDSGDEYILCEECEGEGKIIVFI